MKYGDGESPFGHEPGAGEDRLSQALRHLRAEAVPVDSLKRALSRAQRLSAPDAKRDSGKSATTRKPRLPGFDQLEDRQALSGLGWDGAAFETADFELAEVVAVVTTEPMRPVMSSYSTQSATPTNVDRGSSGDNRWTAEPLFYSDVHVAGIDVGFEHIEEDPALEELLGTLVSGAV